MYKNFLLIAICLFLLSSCEDITSVVQSNVTKRQVSIQTMSNNTTQSWIQPLGQHDCYNTGDKVSFQGNIYFSEIDANIWAPNIYPSGWRLVTSISTGNVVKISGVFESWVQPLGAHDCYDKGDTVSFDQKIYVSEIDANVWAPNVYPSGWRFLQDVTLPNSTLTILSYNIHHGKGTDGKLDLQRIADIINMYNPDLVALQELDVNTTRTNKVNQPESLSVLTGMNYAFSKSIDFQGGEYGNAILSRYPISGKITHPLPGKEKRSALEVQVSMTGIQNNVTFISTHLSLYKTEQAQSIEIINNLVKSHSDFVILAGDLNITPQSNEFQKLKSYWLNATSGSNLYTFPAKKPTTQIDFVLAYPIAAWKVIDCKVINDGIASDHRPILTKLEL